MYTILYVNGGSRYVALHKELFFLVCLVQLVAKDQMNYVESKIILKFKLFFVSA